MSTVAMTTTLDGYLLDDYLVARFRATTADGTAPDRPLNLALLIDNSGSMDGERLIAVQCTLHAARELLRPADRITLVTFSDSARLMMNHVILDADGITRFYDTIDSLNPYGSTNLSAGLETLFSAGTDYDAIVLLTDGQVNLGITTTAGLRAMALGGVRGRAINALGYGADHNRALLRDLATESHGTYTYVDSDEILPVAIGDILTGLRTELLQGIRVEPDDPTGWHCMEVNGSRIGSVVADRDYWMVYSRGLMASMGWDIPFAVRAEDTIQTCVRLSESSDMTPVVREQIIRARVAQLLGRISQMVEGNGREAVTPADRSALAALQEEIRALPVRPLLLRILGQLAEASALFEAPASPSLLRTVRGSTPMTPPRIHRQSAASSEHLLARLASGYTTLSQQRGVYSQTAAETEVAPTEPRPLNLSMFSSPLQITSSRVAHERYTHIPAEPQ